MRVSFENLTCQWLSRPSSNSYTSTPPDELLSMSTAAFSPCQRVAYTYNLTHKYTYTYTYTYTDTYTYTYTDTDTDTYTYTYRDTSTF